MGDETIKVVREVSPEVSLQQLEHAATKLRGAQVRGEEPQISFAFVQRLIDEVIEKRRGEIASQKMVDNVLAEMSKDPVLSDEDVEHLLEALDRNDDMVEPYDLTGLDDDSED